MKIGDRVICPEYPYLGEMEIIQIIYETPKKVEFIAKGNTVFVQGTDKLFTLAKSTQSKQLSLF